ncbi:MAG TPA: dihydropteroate synthase [Actinomycetota bacterium]|jgi:dihydropteroate synthase|nr:dihydropteroate synthase [Actinomycetota bacterium]
MPEGTALIWRCGARTIECGGRTLLMGVLNVTPDSFSDGGRFLDPDAALGHGLAMMKDGADMVDIGGESTRPGSDPVPLEEELRRVLPVVQALASRTAVPLSIDTRHAAVAEAALRAGAVIVNDISGGREPGMFDVVKAAGAGLVLMHMRGDPKTMQEAPTYTDVVGEVKDYLARRLEAAIFAGLSPEQLVVDPGIGFGKDLEHNLELLRRLDALGDLGRPILVGPSRKRFIGTLLDLAEDERVEGTAGVAAWAATHGASIVRVHDVKQISRVIRLVDAIALGR